MITGPVTGSQAEKVKFVDDGTVAVSINLKRCLEKDPVSRTEHILPPVNNLMTLSILLRLT